MAIFNTVYGGVKKWKPGAKTIAYYPLNSITTTSDMKGTGTAYDLTNYNVSFTTYQGVDCGVFYGNTNYSSGLYHQTTPTRSSGNYTFQCWFYIGTDTMTGLPRIQGFYGYPCCLYNMSGYYGINNAGSGSPRAAVSAGQWYLGTITWEGSAVKLYMNANLEFDGTDGEYSTRFGGTKSGINIGGSDNPGSNYDKFSGGISEVIYESKARTADEILAYYNQNKSKYGIS